MRLKDLLVYIEYGAHIRIVDRKLDCILDGEIKDAYNNMEIKYYNYPVRCITSCSYGSNAILIELDK